MQQSLDKIKEAGIQLVGISYDSPEILKTFADRESITFPLLSDPDSKIIEAYHIRNTEAGDGKAKGVPYPGTFLVDEKGIIRAKLGLEGYRKRHSPTELLNAAQALNASD